MKHLQLYEAWTKNIKPGDIYVIDEIIISSEKYSTNIRLGRILDIDWNHFIVKTFLKGSNKEYIFYMLGLKNIKRKANKEEILEFETIENSNKYNL